MIYELYMAKNHTSPLIENLLSAMEEKRFNQRSLALEAGINETGVRDILRGASKNPRRDTLEKLAKALKMPLSKLVGDDTEKEFNETIGAVKVLGMVKAGDWLKSHQWDEDECYFIDAPTRGFKNTYGLVIKGDSMNRIFSEGEILVVCPISNYTNTLRSGDYVIVERTNYTGSTEATAKELEIKDGKALLWPRSHNPEYTAPVSISWPHKTPDEAGLETVEIKGVVISAARVFK